jgi:DNA-binding winged helix-turn-helix (wHTH) protein
MVSFDSGPFCFGEFEFNPSTRELRRHGLRVRVKPQAMTLLCLLVEQPVRMRTREEIQRRLWPGNTFVDFEHSLNKVVHSLREALGDSAFNPRFIETVATQGYRFLPAFAEQCMAKRGRNDEGVVYLAVLPIAVAGNGEQAFLASRLTSRLTDEISAIEGERVIAESTMKNHWVEGEDPRSTGERLGVRSVVVGELTRHKGVLYLRVELIDVADGRQLCSARAERVLQRATLCERELAQEIVQQMSPSLMQLVVKATKMREPLVLNRRASDRQVSIM